MILKKKSLLIGILIIAISLLAVSACKRKSFHNPERIKSIVSWHIDDVLDDIDATDDQIVKINAIKERVLNDLIEKYKKGKAHKLSAVKAWEKDEVDMESVYAKIDERLSERKKTAYMIADAIKEIHGILTKEQRAIIAKDLRERLTD